MHRSGTVCVDASVVVRGIIETDEPGALELWERWLSDRTSLVAPDLIFYEVTNALYRYQLAGHRPSAVVAEALRVSRSFPIRLYSGTDLHQAALTFAERFSFPAAYDAHYLALADRMGAEFWTADKRLANAVRPQLGWVRVLGE